MGFSLCVFGHGLRLLARYGPDPLLQGCERITSQVFYNHLYTHMKLSQGHGLRLILCHGVHSVDPYVDPLEQSYDSCCLQRHFLAIHTVCV